MGEQFPSLRGRTMRRILTRLCGEPVSGGNHLKFRSPATGRLFVYGYHDSRDIRGDMVRRILVTQVGLTPDQARKEAR